MSEEKTLESAHPGSDHNPVALTAPAVAKVAALLAAEADGRMALRIGVRPGGCSGYSYEMFFDTERGPNDVEWAATAVVGEVELAVPVVVDESSVLLLTGATLEHRDGLSGGFTINNPNAQKSCGCGQSFS